LLNVALIIVAMGALHRFEGTFGRRRPEPDRDHRDHRRRSLGADLTWYALGRWWGPRLLNVFGQDLPGTGTLVQCAGQAFGSHLGGISAGRPVLT